MLSDSELNMILDIVSTHLVRHENGGQKLAPGWERHDVPALLDTLSEEEVRRENSATADAVGEGDRNQSEFVFPVPPIGSTASVDPFDNHPDAEENSSC